MDAYLLQKILNGPGPDSLRFGEVVCLFHETPREAMDAMSPSVRGAFRAWLRTFDGAGKVMDPKRPQFDVNGALDAFRAVGSGDFSIGGEVWPGTSKLLEEAGEVQQVLGKLIGKRGAVDHWDGTNLSVRLHEEIGDLQAAITFFTEANHLDQDLIQARAATKLALFREWQEKGQ